jgi:hypothetical protein
MKDMNSLSAALVGKVLLDGDQDLHTVTAVAVIDGEDNLLARDHKTGQTRLWKLESVRYGDIEIFDDAAAAEAQIARERAEDEKAAEAA